LSPQSLEERNVERAEWGLEPLKREDLCDIGQIEEEVQMDHGRIKWITPETRRVCLKCGDEFLSSGRNNRLCDSCREENHKVDFESYSPDNEWARKGVDWENKHAPVIFPEDVSPNWMVPDVYDNGRPVGVKTPKRVIRRKAVEQLAMA